MAGIVLLFALICIRKTSCTFDGVRRTALVRTRTPFNVSERSIPFDDIEDVVLDADTLGGQSPQFRLALLTAGGAIPLAGSYGAGSKRYEATRQALLEFLTRSSLPSRQTAFPAAPSPTPAQPPTSELDHSVIELLRQGRKIDAITLFRTTHNASLTEAKRHVDEVADRLKPVP